MSALEDIIRERVEREGRITFAEFADLALYHPSHGYYTSGRQNIGPKGDFFTSPSAHPVFGALLCLQLEEMWRLLGSPPSFTVLEMGAGKGLLAKDVLAFSEKLDSAFAAALRYVATDRGASDATEASSLVLPCKPFSGCILSNELLDAFPVHRVAVQNGVLREVYVALHEGRLVETLGPLSTDEIARSLDREAVKLDEGYRTEVNLGIGPWMEAVAASLERGFVLTIDYGYEAAELYSPERREGTLVTYHHHTCGSSPLECIGEQDISVHVDFTAVILAGVDNGLRCQGLVRQREFLLNLGFDAFVRALAGQRLDHVEYAANRFAMAELVREEGLGEFRVLVQSKGLDQVRLSGLCARGGTRAALTERKRLRVPLLDDEHMPLWEARHL